MPQDNQDLFNVMDSALKRQREGRAQRFRAPGEERPGEVKPPAPSGRLGPAQAQPAPPAAPGEPVSHAPEFPNLPEGQGAGNEITRRLYPMPESARSAPASGSLSPGEVLRGTVFGSGRFKPAGAAPASQVLLPVQEEPPPPAPPPGPPSTRQAPVRPIAAATLRARSGLLSGSGARPALGPAERPPALAGSNRYEPAAVSAPTNGFFLRTEVALVALLGMVVGAFVIFILGHRMGEADARQRSAPPEKGRVEKPAPVGSVPKPVPGLEHPAPAPSPAPIQSPVLPGPGPAPAPAPAPVVTPPPAALKFALRVRTYNDPASAEKLAGTLRAKRFPDVRVVKLSTGGVTVHMVLTGHFVSKGDPEAEKLRRQVLNQVDSRFSPSVVQD